MNTLELDHFLSANRIDTIIWEKCGLQWETMKEIADHYYAQHEHLRDTAELIARVIQRIPHVHSVRWRIKDTEHLLEKIIRKCSAGAEKYRDINAGNYSDIVSDLIGVRALHLFKDDAVKISDKLLEIWNPCEEPVMYIRNGDADELISLFEQRGHKIEPHAAGYRSVHYVISTQPLHRKILAEIQVRSIFEEGWSEIDHKIRYPNFSSNQIVSYFLGIFNRLAGSADEMGTFVKGLAVELAKLAENVDNAKAERDRTLEAMSSSLRDLEALKAEDQLAKQKIAALQSELQHLQKLNASSMNGADRSILEVNIGQVLARAARHNAGIDGSDFPNIHALRLADGAFRSAIERYGALGTAFEAVNEANKLSKLVSMSALQASSLASSSTQQAALEKAFTPVDKSPKD